MLVQGNYFYKTGSTAVDNETGFNMQVTGNLFQDDGWGDGQGNGVGYGVELNSSGGWNVPGSRYENQALISGNQFVNDWGGVQIWQAGARSCENSGENWPDDAAYCSGGYPNSATTAGGGQYYYSHDGDNAHGGTTTVEQAASSGSSTVLVQGAEAIDDQIGFSDPASTTTTTTTNVSSLSGSQTIDATSTSSFPSSGQLRVGTSAAWSDAGGSYTGAILSYTGKTSTTFTGVALVRGSGTLAGPVLQVQSYKVTAETCYANDCALTISPTLAASEASGATVTNAGTCQLFATSAALPSGPLAPDGSSYWDGCQWESQHISVASNNFVFEPSLIASSAPVSGGSTTVCNASNNDDCGTNFMAYQVSGEAPFSTQIGGNAMMSSSSFTGCPSWDSGCSSDPFSNLNALSSPPGAPAGNGEAPGNNAWSSNTYNGPWAWSNAYLYGDCSPLPIDPTTGKSVPTGACGTGFPQWQSDWQQDTNSTYTPVAVSISNLVDDQTLHGPAQNVIAYEDTGSGATIGTTLLVGTNTDSVVPNLPNSPHTFTLNTLNYQDGSYNIEVAATDSNGKSGSDTVPVFITNGDLNGDSKVNISDLAIMASHWGQTDSNYSHGNITGQSTIGISDLAVMANNWNKSW